MPRDIPHIALLRAVMAAYEQSFAHIDGVTIDEVRGRDTVMIRGTGRSPSLLRATIEWTHRMTDLTRRLDAPDQAMRGHVMATVEAAFDGDGDAASRLLDLGLLAPDPDLVDIQAHRLGDARGMLLDLVTPPTCARILADRDAIAAVPHAQVAIDRYTVELVERMLLETTACLPSRRAVHRRLVSLLCHANDGVITDGHIFQAEPTDQNPWEVTITDRPLQKERRLLVHLPMPTGPDAHFDGETLVLLKAIPHTVQAAAIGRTLGEIVRTGTPLDARRILDIDHYEMGRTDLTLEMDAVSLDTL